MRKSRKQASKDDPKNIVRGALSYLKRISTPINNSKTWQQEQLAHKQISNALQQAKKRYSISRYKEFEGWVNEQLLNTSNKSKNVGTSLFLLGVFPNEVTSDSLEKEIATSISNILIKKNRINSFIIQAKTLHDCIRSGLWSDALDILGKIRDSEGRSYWEIETLLYITQVNSGHESLKSLSSELSKVSVGLSRYFIYQFGVRNEPAQKSFRLISNIKKVIDDSDLSIALKDYSKYRVIRHLECDENILSNILSCEKLTNPIDLLFTLLVILKFIKVNKRQFSEKIIKCADLAITEIKENIPLDVFDVFGENLKNNPLASKISQQSIKAVLERKEIEALYIYKIMQKGIVSQLETRSDKQSYEDLSKLMMNLWWIPECLELHDINKLPELPILLYESRYYSEELDINSVKEIILSEIKNKSNFRSESPIIKLLKINDGSGTLKIDSIKECISSSELTIEKDCSNILLINILIENDIINDAIVISSEMGIEDSRLIKVLPLVEIFINKKWPAIKDLSNHIDLSICLDHLQRVSNDRKIKTFKRYSIISLLKEYDCKHITELPKKLINSGISTKKVEYLFNIVCDPSTIELLPNMGGSKPVHVARLQLLEELRNLNTQNKDTYQQEIDQISENIDIDDGLNVIDDSKVYVDESTILNIVNSELASDFNRYLQLLRSGIGEVSSLNDLIKNMDNPTAKIFQIPVNEADALLASIVNGIMEKFLFEPVVGLDIIIGRRIRHGEISGEIRGVLEQRGFIGQKPKSGAEYNLPSAVEELAVQLDHKKKKRIYSIFSNFSRDIDKLIAHLRDDLFSVRSAKKPRGIFDLTLSPELVTIARSFAQECENIEIFSIRCLELFWAVLSVKSPVHQKEIETDIKKTLHGIFNKLNGHIRSLGISDPKFLSNLQVISDELQRKAVVISSWTRIPQMNIEGKKYSLANAIDVAIAKVSSQQPGFEPKVCKNLSDEFELDAHGFQIVQDALYIAIDNIAKHSGKKNKNEIEININYSTKSSMISFDILNEVTKQAKTKEKKDRLDEVRFAIEKKVYKERAKGNKGSGLSKLASIVYQNENSKIDFGYKGDKHFYLSFDLLFVGKTVHIKKSKDKLTELRDASGPQVI